MNGRSGGELETQLGVTGPKSKTAFYWSMASTFSLAVTNTGNDNKVSLGYIGCHSHRKKQCLALSEPASAKVTTNSFHKHIKRQQQNAN